MMIAYVKGSEIIPFESVEFVEDVCSNEDKPHIRVHMRDSKKEKDLNLDDASDFIKTYSEYINAMSRAMMIIEDDEQ